MNEHDVIRFMGRFPDKIISKPLVSKIWKCSCCDEIYIFDKERECPTPCEMCEGICFETVKGDSND